MFPFPTPACPPPACLTPECLAALTPLDDARYMEAHLAFRGRSTQQTVMADWLKETLTAERRASTGKPAVPFRLISIGSGTGILDAPVLTALQDAGPVAFTGVDPNPLENAMCRETVGRVLSENSTCEVIDGVIETYDPGEPFDAAMAVHVFYYSPDVALALRRALTALKPGGAFLILNAPDNPLSSFFVATTRHLKAGATPCLTPELTARLSHLGADVAAAPVEARVDVTEMEDPATDVCWLLVDFILHADTGALPGGMRDQLRLAILDLAAREADGRTWLPHTVDAVIARPGAARKRDPSGAAA